MSTMTENIKLKSLMLWQTEKSRTFIRERDGKERLSVVWKPAVMMYLAYVQEYVNRREQEAKGQKAEKKSQAPESGLFGRFQKLRKERERK